jgi:methylenetetrahydrofolate reductase (NADPH)
MHIPTLLNGPQPTFSFEFYPPKTAAGEAALMATLNELSELEPGFVSVTCGAAGTPQGDITALVERIQREHGLLSMAHLTCTGLPVDALNRRLERLRDAGIRNVLALRGDPPAGTTRFEAVEGGLRYASELVALIHERGHPFTVGGAAYPEGHVETPSRDTDLLHLKAKVDAGLDFVITQLFFDNAFYFDFVERCRKVGITVPIVPGIMPITNYAQVQRFTRMCGATVPMRLALQLEKIKDRPEAVTQLGVAHATVQCLELLERGVPGIHFYTLNQSPATRMIVSALRGRSGT